MLLHVLLAIGSTGAVQDAAAAAPHELPIVATWSIDDPTPFVGERVTVEFALEGPTEFLANEVVPRTLRRLDRAVEFDIGLGSEGTALLEVVGFEEASDGLTCIAGGTVVRGARLDLGNGRERFVVRADVRAVAAGVLQPAPRLVLAVRQARAVGIFGAEVTSDYDVHTIAAPAPALEVRALPSGAQDLAVGVFELVADAPPLDRVAPGERITLVARVRGAEDRARVAAPRLESGGALHVLGGLRADDEAAATAVFTFDCEVVGPLTSTCAFLLTTFDPTGAGRVVEHRAPLALAIDAPEVADAAVSRGATRIDETPEFRTRALVAVSLGAILAAIAAFVVLRRRRAAARALDPRIAAARSARATVLERGDAAAALAAFVETLFEVPVAARNGAALQDHLTRAAVPPELAQRVTQHLDAARDARYGGGGEPLAPSLADELCAELEHAARRNPRIDRR
jgi:hypothetical protein